MPLTLYCPILEPRGKSYFRSTCRLLRLGKINWTPRLRNGFYNILQMVRAAAQFTACPQLHLQRLVVLTVDMVMMNFGRAVTSHILSPCHDPRSNPKQGFLQSCSGFGPIKGKIQVLVFRWPAPAPKITVMYFLIRTPPKSFLNATYFPFKWTLVWILEQKEKAGREQGVYSASKPPLALVVMLNWAASVTSD